MDVTPLDGAKWFGLKPQPPKQELNMQTFMRLLTVQLTHQNPLEPMNDRDFFAQMAQLGSVQGFDQMKKSLEVSQGASMMGKLVSAVRPMTESGLSDNTLVFGMVRKLSVKNGEYWLGIEEPDGGLVDVRMSAVQSIEE